MIAFALHGGAGETPANARDESPYRDALRQIAEDGVRRLRAGDSALDVVQAVVEQLEDCPLFNAGIGGVLNREGLPELDAALMEGTTRRSGAVIGVQRVRSPIRLARALLDNDPHCLYAMAGAEARAIDHGLPMVPPEFFITEERQQQLVRARARDRVELDHDVEDSGNTPDSAAFGTVGCVARDARGRLAAATSTGGLTNKRPGRVGDSPLIGAGTYADDQGAAVSCTGTGESFIRACAAHSLHARLRWGGESLDAAAQAVLDDVRQLGGRGGLIAIDRHGTLTLPFNTRAMYRAWLQADGRVRVGIRHGDET